MRKTVFSALLFVIGMLQMTARTAVRDTMVHTEVAVPVNDTCVTTDRVHGFSLHRLIVPAALVAVGGFGVDNGAMHKLNSDVRSALGGGKHKRIRIDEVMPYLPAAAAYGLDMCGVKAEHGWKDRTIILVLSAAISQGISKGTKALINEWRPDGSDHHSFPSGHTTMAFMSAELLRMEYRDCSPWIAVAGYVVATGTGVMRMYNDKHWLNDVIAGAGIGILGTRIAYWIYPWVKRHLMFHKTGKEASALLLPYYDPAGSQGKNRTSQGTCGLMLAVSF